MSDLYTHLRVDLPVKGVHEDEREAVATRVRSSSSDLDLPSRNVTIQLNVNLPAVVLPPRLHPLHGHSKGDRDMPDQDTSVRVVKLHVK
jgi:hypothetical protein